MKTIRKNEKELMMKKMTKKEYKAYVSMQRSQVGRDINLGIRTMKSVKDYDRNKSKCQTKAIIADMA